MNESGSLFARLAFLERELDRMGNAADAAERELRLNPTDPEARRRLVAIYALAGKTWAEVQELRACQPDRYAVIRYDQHANAAAGRAWRQALG